MDYSEQILHELKTIKTLVFIIGLVFCAMVALWGVFSNHETGMVSTSTTATVAEP